MKNRLTALLTAGIMLASAAPITTANAEEKNGIHSLIGQLPVWTPLDFADALQFYNEHGKCLLADNYICIVRPIPKDRVDEYELYVSGGMTNVNTPVSAGRRLLELDIPEIPDPDDTEAVKEYEDYCDRLGLYSHDHSFFEEYAESGSQYVFEVEMFRVLEGLDLKIMLAEPVSSWHPGLETSYTITNEYTFENHDGKTVQTDVYSWLPDSVPEYNAFFNQYGPASVQENYIAYCSDYESGTGAVMEMEQSGEGSIKEALVSECKPFVLEPQDGSVNTSVTLYEPTADGMTDVKWTISNKISRELISEWYGKYEINNDCTEITDLSSGKPGKTIFTFIDKDTNEVIDISNALLMKTTMQDPYISVSFDITSNPCTVDDFYAYDQECSYSFNFRSEAGGYNDIEFEKTSETSDCIEVTCYMKWNPGGDLNSDRSFGVADLLLMNKWLLGDGEVQISDWKAADFCRDNKLDVFDLCIMRQAVIRRLSETVMPDTPVDPVHRFYTPGSDRHLYAGPGTEYKVLDTVPAFEFLYEWGYNNGNEDWVYTIFDGKKGWIRTVVDGEPNVVFTDLAYDKPVIYLYPEKETDVHVELDLTTSELSTTYPKYNGGWDVTAFPDGSLINKADGSHHRYLFWDSVNCRTDFDLSKGFCVAGCDTESFLKEKLTYMGLTEEEMNEFIVYWLPRMEHNPYNLISFQGDAYTDSAKLYITPTPDSICRIFMTYVPLEKPVDAEPQQLSSFERKGFTVVEWGGSEIG